MTKNFAEMPPSSQGESRWGKPFWKKVESRENFTCDCARKLRKEK